MPGLADPSLSSDVWHSVIGSALCCVQCNVKGGSARRQKPNCDHMIATWHEGVPIQKPAFSGEMGSLIE